MWYEYRCERCGEIYETQYFTPIGRTFPGRFCDCSGKYIRIVSIPQLTPPSAEPYWNYTTGSVVTSNRDFEQQLKVGAERMSERLGYEQKFSPVYPSEKNAYVESTASNDGEQGQSIEKYSKLHHTKNEQRTIIT